MKKYYAIMEDDGGILINDHAIMEKNHDSMTDYHAILINNHAIMKVNRDSMTDGDAIIEVGDGYLRILKGLGRMEVVNLDFSLVVGEQTPTTAGNHDSMTDDHAYMKKNRDSMAVCDVIIEVGNGYLRILKGLVGLEVYVKCFRAGMQAGLNSALHEM